MELRPDQRPADLQASIEGSVCDDTRYEHHGQSWSYRFGALDAKAWLQQQLDEGCPMSILDVGCGDGRFLRDIKEHGCSAPLYLRGLTFGRDLSLLPVLAVDELPAAAEHVANLEQQIQKILAEREEAIVEMDNHSRRMDALDAMRGRMRPQHAPRIADDEAMVSLRKFNMCNNALSHYYEKLEEAKDIIWRSPNPLEYRSELIDFKIYEEMNCENLCWLPVDFIEEKRSFDVILCSWTALHVRDPLGLLVQMYDLLTLGGTLLVNMFHAVVESPLKEIPPIDHAAVDEMRRQHFPERCVIRFPTQQQTMRIYFVGGYVELLQDLVESGYDVCVDAPWTVKEAWLPATSIRGPFLHASPVPLQKLTCLRMEELAADLGIRRHSEQPLKLSVRYTNSDTIHSGRVYGRGRNDESFSVLYKVEGDMKSKPNVSNRDVVLFPQPSGDLASWATCSDYRLTCEIFRQAGFPKAASCSVASFAHRGPMAKGTQREQTSVGGSKQESVTCLVDHAEEGPGVQVDMEVAQTYMDVAWADNAQSNVEAYMEELRTDLDNFEPPHVEHEKDAPMYDTDVSDGSDVMENVYMLRFGGGDTETFRARLLEGPEFKPCREELKQAGYACVLPEKALLFIHPSQYRIVKDSLVGFKLHPYHVIVTESLSYLVTEALETMAYRKRPKEKKNDRNLVVDGTASLHKREEQFREGKSHEDLQQEYFKEYGLVLCHTFLCSAPLRRAPQSVTQSTTEAIAKSESHYAYERGVNPRRAVPYPVD